MYKCWNSFLVLANESQQKELKAKFLVTEPRYVHYCLTANYTASTLISN